MTCPSSRYPWKAWGSLPGWCCLSWVIHSSPSLANQWRPVWSQIISGMSVNSVTASGSTTGIFSTLKLCRQWNPDSLINSLTCFLYVRSCQSPWDSLRLRKPGKRVRRGTQVRAAELCGLCWEGKVPSRHCLDVNGPLQKGLRRGG